MKLSQINLSLKSGWLWPFLKYFGVGGRSKILVVAGKTAFSILKIKLFGGRCDNCQVYHHWQPQVLKRQTQEYEVISLLRKLLEGRLRRRREEDALLVNLHHRVGRLNETSGLFEASAGDESAGRKEWILEWREHEEVSLCINHCIAEVLLTQLKILLLVLLDQFDELLCFSLVLFYLWVELLRLLIHLLDLLEDRIRFSQISLQLVNQIQIDCNELEFASLCPKRVSSSDDFTLMLIDSIEICNGSCWVSLDVFDLTLSSRLIELNAVLTLHLNFLIIELHSLWLWVEQRKLENRLLKVCRFFEFFIWFVRSEAGCELAFIWLSIRICLKQFAEWRILIW